MTRMRFGKFKGVLLSDLPDDYLRWLRTLDDLREPLRSAVQAEHDLRFADRNRQAGPLPLEARTMAEEIISAGYRKLAAAHHPDWGGEGKMMTAVNLASEWLRQRVRST